MNEAGRQTVGRLELLAGIAFDLLRYDQPDSLLDSAFSRVSEKMGADLCLCYLLEGERLHLAYAGGLSPELRPKAEWLELDDYVCGRALKQRARVGLHDITQSEGNVAEFLTCSGVRSLHSYPLLASSKALGTLSFGSKTAFFFKPDDLELQEAIAGELGLAVDRMLLIAELERKNQELERANAELRRANTDLEQFAFSASHDLREPLRHLALFSELLYAEARDGLSEKARQYVSIIGKSARHIELLVRDLLAYTRAGVDGVSDREEIPAQEAVSEAVQNLRPAIQESGARIDVGPLPAVEASRSHLVQLFQQLLENALKYRRPGVTPEIQVSAGERDGQAAFCVRDNGIGIAPEHQRRIFGLFKRLHTSEEYEGTGIGLAICQKIVEHYRGKIWVESRRGEGAAFFFTLGKRNDEGKSVSAAANISR
jgi:signal transduction histidine kinase